MWCKHCSDDVPAIAGGDGLDQTQNRSGNDARATSPELFYCARCGEVMGSRDAAIPAASSVEDTTNAELTWNESPLSDCWALDQQLHDVEQVLKRRPLGEAPSPYDLLSPEVGILEDAPLVMRIDRPAPPKAATQQLSQRRTTAPKRSLVLPWMVLLIGIMAFACGGVLLGMSLVQGRDDLWSYGIPFTIGGQAAMLIGLVLLMEGIWHSSRHTAQQLDDVDARLESLQQTTLAGGGHPSSQAFYAHLATGAQPHLLANDLKHQIDLLSQRVDMKR